MTTPERIYMPAEAEAEMRAMGVKDPDHPEVCFVREDLFDAAIAKAREDAAKSLDDIANALTPQPGRIREYEIGRVDGIKQAAAAIRALAKPGEVKT